MRLIRHLGDVPAEGRGAVVALGNFDGVHLGHQAVILQTAEIARARRAPLGVLTFEPHPRSFFRPEDPVFRLTPFRIKTRHLQALGVDHLFELTFDAEMAGRTAENFVEEILVAGLGVAHVVVGYDFCFGKGRTGNAALLTEYGGRHGFGVTSVAAAKSGEGPAYSSTLVRQQLQAGDPKSAAATLGRPWEIEGRVEHGEARGRLLGFPTANVAIGEYLEPKLGVYAIMATLADEPGEAWVKGVANLGRRPTVGGTRVQLETHLFDFAGDLYGKHLRVALIDFIRPEKKFDGLDALKAQIAADSAQARDILAAYRGPAPGGHPGGKQN
ncbi:FMN adenylyltransferase /riboflavin kinase [Dongia mobilis]|uniref:Riboflavin biosynthesis protein n=1 Tax=Dongia mobilis TaxID=578943 RepID=A0A4R6WW04_9PROT|nr:bifunctional riboflavin kinase/FAD synthetase [Dongia mobilis]TDQ83202.1 FMN adenylyltransferase /riboflavin kinase [Dongia mobilis]